MPDRLILYCSEMFLQLLEGLGADVMFHPAGILGGLGFADPQLYKPAGKELVALIDARGDLEALDRKSVV